MADRTLAGLRTTVFDLLDWAPTQSDEAVRRANSAINDCLQDFVTSHPLAFSEVGGIIQLYADLTPTVTGDAVSVHPDDAWVLQRDVLETVPDVTNWNVQGKWDARTIWIEDADGNWQKRQIRTVWRDGDQAYLTLLTPWTNRTDSGMRYILSNDTYWLPGDVLNMRAAQQIRGQYMPPIRFLDTEMAESFGFNVIPALVGPTNYITTAYRRPSYQMTPIPRTAPTTADAGVWVGPQAKGRFQYACTLCWGRRSIQELEPTPETAASAGASTEREEPLFESPPSPVSVVVSNTALATGFWITCPNINLILGFNDAATPRYHRTGLYYRIYRKRITAASGNYDIDDRYYHIGDVDTSGGSTTFQDDGSYVPDVFRPLRTNYNYTGLQFTPRPSQDITIDLRYRRKPDPLVDDQDVPEMSDSIAKAVAYKAAMQIAMWSRDVDRAAFARQLYESMINGELRQYAVRPVTQPTYRRPARVRGSGWGV